MKIVTITSQRVRSDRSSHLVSFDGVLSDEIGNKRAVNGSFAVSNLDAIPGQIRANLVRRLGFGGFEVVFPDTQDAPEVKRGPGRPPGSRNVA